MYGVLFIYNRNQSQGGIMKKKDKKIRYWFGSPEKVLFTCIARDIRDARAKRDAHFNKGAK